MFLAGLGKPDALSGGGTHTSVFLTEGRILRVNFCEADFVLLISLFLLPNVSGWSLAAQYSICARRVLQLNVVYTREENTRRRTENEKALVFSLTMLEGTQDEVEAEAVEFDLKDVKTFVHLVTFIAPSCEFVDGAVRVACSLLSEQVRCLRFFLGAEGTRGGGGAGPSASGPQQTQSEDWQSLHLTFRREGLVLRGASRAREVHAELLLPVAFFEAFDFHEKQDLKVAQEKDTHETSALVPLKPFVTMLSPFGDSVGTSGRPSGTRRCRGKRKNVLSPSFA